MLRKSIFPFLVFLFSITLSASVYAQQVGPEPSVVPESKAKTPLSYGLKNGLGFNLVLNNFGFGLGGQYRRVLSPMSELTLDLQITGLRNVSEQTFQSYFGQVIPNKFNRVLDFPLMLGVKRRIFANKIQDNFRIYLTAGGGPSLAFIYPYFKDYNGNKIRDEGIYGLNPQSQYEPINDIFSGWKDGHFKWGAGGKLAVGIDFGSKMKSITSVEFGYYFQYYQQGIQILEPRKYKLSNSGALEYDSLGNPITEPGSPKQKFFGSPMISLVFGGMW